MLRALLLHHLLYVDRPLRVRAEPVKRNIAVSGKHHFLVRRVDKDGVVLGIPSVRVNVGTAFLSVIAGYCI